MRAVTFDRHGDPAEVLSLRDVPVPELRPGQVRVRMRTAAINPSDLMYVRGSYIIAPKFPSPAGFEGAGVVEASQGTAWGRFLRGRRVCVLQARGGAWADETVLPAAQVVPVPRQISDEQAAMFFVNPATAWIMTRSVLGMPRGAWLLQTAAGSALGRMVIRLGRHAGFRTLNIVRRAEQAEELRALGADEVVTFDGGDEGREAFITRVQELTKGGLAHAIDAVGGATGTAVVRCLGPRGRVLVYGALAGEPLEVSPRQLIGTQCRVEGFWLGPWMQQAGAIEKLRLVRTLGRLISSGVLASDVGRTFRLEEASAAVVEAERTARGGKAVFRCAP